MAMLILKMSLVRFLAAKLSEIFQISFFLITMQIYRIQFLKTFGSNIASLQPHTFKHKYFFEVPSSC